MLMQQMGILFFSAGPNNLVNNILGSLRCKIAEDKNLIQDKWKFVWITDFPMFEHDIETKMEMFASSFHNASFQ